MNINSNIVEVESSCAERIGIIIVDHGSKKEEANLNLLQIVDRFKQRSNYPIVEAAHMEMAEPCIETAFKKCVEQGANHIICHPYFLSKGKHVQTDIPNLLELASKEYPHIKCTITDPIGMQDSILDLIGSSIENTLLTSNSSII
eukprot:gene12666-16981_t